MSLLRGIQEWIGPKALRLSARFNDYVRHSVLENGITIATQPRFISSKMGFHTFIPAGSHTDPSGKEGLVHFLEHVILPPGSGSAFAERGGYRNASTSSLNLEVHGEIENADNPENYILHFLKSVFLDNVDHQLFELERRRIMNEIGMDNDNIENVHRNMDIAIYSDGGVHTNILGTKESLRGINIEDIERHRRKWFVGENIYLAATGVRDHSSFVIKAAEILGDIPKGQKYKPAPPVYTPAEIRRDADNVHQTYYSIHFPIPARAPHNHYTIRMLDKIISYKINKNIIENEGMAYSAYTEIYAPFQRSGLFKLTANSLPEDSGTVVSILSSIVKDIVGGDFNNEWSLAKRSVKDDLTEGEILLPMAPQDTQIMARSMMTLNRIVTMADMDNYAKSVTMADVHELARNIFLQPPSLTVYGKGENIPDLDTISHALNESISIKKAPDERRGFHL